MAVREKRVSMTNRQGNSAWGRSLLGGLLIAFILTGANGCGKKQESKDQVPTRDINLVMTDHTKELMAIPGVTGVAVGELDDGTPCILVLIEKESAEIDQKVPKRLEGHPIKIIVSGKIEPMSGN
jgi:hypothetical protein